MNFLRVPPANQLELLTGDRKEHYSIRINDQFRICFKFENGDAFNVEIIDYHQEFAMQRDLPPIHPSEILKEDFMLPFEITPKQLAADIHIPVAQLEGFLAEKQPLTANLALRLACYFATDAQSWLNLQTHYDLEIAQSVLQNELKNTIKPLRISEHYVTGI